MTTTTPRESSTRVLHNIVRELCVKAGHSRVNAEQIAERFMSELLILVGPAPAYQPFDPPGGAVKAWEALKEGALSGKTRSEIEELFPEGVPSPMDPPPAAEEIVKLRGLERVLASEQRKAREQEHYNRLGRSLGTDIPEETDPMLAGYGDAQSPAVSVDRGDLPTQKVGKVIGEVAAEIEAEAMEAFDKARVTTGEFSAEIALAEVRAQRDELRRAVWAMLLVETMPLTAPGILAKYERLRELVPNDPDEPPF